MTVSEQTFTEAEHLVARAKSRMVREHPFYASLLFRLEIKPSLEIDTMATDGKSILYNPAWVITLTVAEVAGVLAHEVAHVAYCHHLRKNGRDHKWWNAACDYAINGGLISAGFVLPEGGLYDKAYVGKSSEWIYAQIFPKPEDQESEFEGGDLELMSEGKIAKIKQGHAVFFASFIRHRVKPVTRGRRQSLVMWFGGTPFK